MLAASVERHRGPARRPEPSPAWSVSPQMAIAPREAFFAANETVAADAAVGRISAELVAPYPPGIPVLAPGEMITADALAALRTAKDQGGRIAYAADPSLATFQVITSGSPHPHFESSASSADTGKAAFESSQNVTHTG
jgi:lysine decarboxylase